jgi:hypothetical protein
MTPFGTHRIKNAKGPEDGAWWSVQIGKSARTAVANTLIPQQVVRRDHLVEAKLVKRAAPDLGPAAPSSPNLLPPPQQESPFMRPAPQRCAIHFLWP